MDRAERGRSGGRTKRRLAVAAGRGRSGQGPAQRQGVRTGRLQSPGNRRGGRAAPPPPPVHFRARGPSSGRRVAGAQGRRDRRDAVLAGLAWRDAAHRIGTMLGMPRHVRAGATNLPCGCPAAAQTGRPVPREVVIGGPPARPPTAKLAKHTPRPAPMNSVIAYHSQYLQSVINPTAVRPCVSATLDQTARRRPFPSRPYAVRGNMPCAGNPAPLRFAGAGRPDTSRTGRAPLKADPVDGDSRHAPTSAPTVRPRYAGPAGPAPPRRLRKRGLAGLAPAPPAKIPWARMTVWTVGGASS